jgi:predicted nucleic acid-binding Zn finger protein
MKPANIKKLQARARRLIVKRVTRDTFVVASRSRPSLQHVVTIAYERDGAIHARCTCPWAAHGGFGCAHVMAVLFTLAAGKRRRISFWGTREEAARQRQRVLRLAGSSQDALYITSRPFPRVRQRKLTPQAA